MQACQSGAKLAVLFAIFFLVPLRGSGHHMTRTARTVKPG